MRFFSWEVMPLCTMSGNVLLHIVSAIGMPSRLPCGLYTMGYKTCHFFVIRRRAGTALHGVTLTNK